jgi:hypothetical protein
MNSYADKLFEKQKRVCYFVTVGVIVQSDDGHGTKVKGNDDGGCSSDDMMLCLRRR